MTNIAPIKKEEAIKKVSLYFQPILQVIFDEYIMPAEQVFFVADATRHEIKDKEGTSLLKTLAGDYDTSTHKDVILNQASLLVITNSRWIRWSLNQFKGQAIQIQRIGGFLGGLFDGFDLKFEWIIPPTDSFVQKEQVAKYVTERISIVNLNEVQVSTREEFTIKNQHTTPESELHLLRLPVGKDVSYSLKYDDGIYLHKLLQTASINKGAIPSNTNDNMQQLKQLKAMFDDNLISQQEYDNKKAEILSRM